MSRLSEPLLDGGGGPPAEPPPGAQSLLPRRTIALGGGAVDRSAERAAERAEARRLKARGVPAAVRELAAKTGNYVRTNKYTLLTFPILALKLQFHEVANVYFLFIAVFFAWERVSPVSGVSRFSGAVSLGVVIAYALVLEAIQDLRRWRQDQAVNDAPCRVLAGSGFVQRRWRDLRVGDVVCVRSDETFPADLLLLLSQHKDGLAYIETASLDGETNLKVFEAKPQIVAAAAARASLTAVPDGSGAGFQPLEEQAVVERVRLLEQAGAELECELPSASLYEWSGTVSLASSSGGGRERVAVEAKQLLLRGAVLRKTRWVVGVVVYAGVQTKLQMNDETGKEKTSLLMRKMQRALIWLLLGQLVVSLCFAAAKSGWDATFQARHVYLLQSADPPWWQWSSYLEHTCTFILLLCYMVPISLIMSIQTVKNIQAYFMDNDHGMYHAETNTPSVARSDKLQEELGQVDAIFSDKTGTLTCNEMELIHVCVDGTVYGDGAPHGLYRTLRDLARSSGGEDTPGKGAGMVPEGTVLEVVEIETKDDGAVHGRCLTEVEGSVVGWHPLTDLEPVPGQRLNDDVGLRPLRSSELGRTAALVDERVATGHRHAEELVSFCTALALCHQAEAEHPAADAALNEYRAQRQQMAKRLEQQAFEAVLSDGVEGIDAALGHLSEAVVCEMDQYPPERDAEIGYSAASPDDKALVEGGKALGFVFLARRNGRLLVRSLGELREYSIVSVIPFDSDRKRMSIITQEIVPEVEAAFRLTAWLASRSGAESTEAHERELVRSEPVFAAAHRRRESIIRDTAAVSAPRIWTKGADSIMRPLLNTDGEHSHRRIRQTWAAMERTAGLRTLVVSSRKLSDEVDIGAWQQDLMDCMELPKAQQLRRQTELFQRVECRLDLHGSTAVEDKLQEGVTEVLPKLHRAGIAVWVLTGDKIDTATEIGYTTGLLRAEMNVVTIPEQLAESAAPQGFVDTGDNEADDEFRPAQVLHVRKLLAQLLQELQELEVSVGGQLSGGGAGSLQGEEPLADELLIVKRPLHKHPVGLVIHAASLSIAMEDKPRCSRGFLADGAQATPAANIGGVSYFTTLELFVAVVRTCTTVICCRVSPAQKASVVRLGRASLGQTPGAEAVTLAIGDGANDVPMIKEAHVGVGISGHEGMQAVLASDFSIAQFRFLERLLLVHGRASYFRTSKLILYFIYKSVLFSLTMTWMTWLNGFSGQSIYDGNIAGGFNLLFTFFPVMTLATLDRDLSSDDVLSNPELYCGSQQGVAFTGATIASWALSGVWHSIFLFFGAIYMLNGVDGSGRELNFWQMGTVLFSLVHVTAHVKILLCFSSWTLFAVVVFVLSLSTWFWVWPIYTEIYGISVALNSELYMSFASVGSDARFWLTLLVLPATCGLVDLALKYAQRNAVCQDESAGNRLRYRLQQRYNERLEATSSFDALRWLYTSIGGGRAGAADPPDAARRQQEQARRQATAEAQRTSVSARLPSSSLLGRDDDDSNRRGAEITFGADYVLPRGNAEESARRQQRFVDL